MGFNSSDTTVHGADNIPNLNEHDWIKYLPDGTNDTKIIHISRCNGSNFKLPKYNAELSLQCNYNCVTFKWINGI